MYLLRISILNTNAQFKFNVGGTWNSKRYVHIVVLLTGDTATATATHNCNPSISQNDPETSLLNCNHQTTVVNRPLQHADRYGNYLSLSTKQFLL